MRSALIPVLLAVVTPIGCSLIPDDSPLAALEQIAGRLLGQNEDARNLAVMVAWHPVLPQTEELPPWLEGERGTVVDGSFQLDLHRVPPAAALFQPGSPDWFAEQFGEGSRLAPGHIVAYSTDETQTGPPSFKELVNGDDSAYMVAVNDGRMVLWWQGLRLGDNSRLALQGGPPEPGYNVLQVTLVDEGIQYALKPITDTWDLQLEPHEARPAFQRCRPETVEPNPLEIWVGEGAEFPSVAHACVLCDRGVQVRDCVEVWGLLCNCSNPRLFRLEPDFDTPEAWPCGIAQGDECTEDGARRCSIKGIYRCENAKWVQQYTCDINECCNPGCGPNENFPWRSLSRAYARQAHSHHPHLIRHLSSGHAEL